ncbi:MAG: DUF2442 domain-containing protein [Actinobacteria bacterium]|nr:DUF2442 domain-containing protein [Actinomycetota bacterium]
MERCLRVTGGTCVDGSLPDARHSTTPASSRFLWGRAFEDIATDDELFRAVRVDPELGTLVWPNGSDISPETLYRHSEPTARAS